MNTGYLAAYAINQHAINSGNPLVEDYVVRRLMNSGDFLSIREYILENKEKLSDGKSFPNDNIALKYITEEKLIPTAAATLRFCEDAVKTAVKSGCSQFVILGAGLNTFAFRNSDSVKIFEVDSREQVEDKKSRISEAALDMPENLVQVSADFLKENLIEALEKAGFDKTKKSIFYFSLMQSNPEEAELKKVLKEVSDLCEGTDIVMDFSQNSSIMTEKAKFSGDYQDLEVLLSRNGFEIYEHLDENELSKRYFSDGHQAQAGCLLAVLKKRQEAPEETAAKEKPVPAAEKSEVKVRKPVLNPQKIKKIIEGGTKEKILKVSLKLFSEQGFTAVSVRDIGGELDISQAALYKHYKNKQDILDNIISIMTEQIDEIIRNRQMKNLENEYVDLWCETTERKQFMRLLTICRFSNEKTAGLYNKYFAEGLVEYFEKAGVTPAEEKAALTAFKLILRDSKA